MQLLIAHNRNLWQSNYLITPPLPLIFCMPNTNKNYLMTTIIRAFSLALITLLLVSCATPFDRTNIKPGQRVLGPAVSIEVPTEKSWFAVDYGTKNHIRLSQLNYDDSYTIHVTVNKGRPTGMFRTAESHLRAFISARTSKQPERGVIEQSHREWVARDYGPICIGYSSLTEDWRGRSQPGPALVDLIGLTCPHRHLPNILVDVEISRRYELDAPRLDLSGPAKQLFSSIKHYGDD